MAVVGGIILDPQFEAIAESPSDISAVDPWPQGLGIFDLSAMQWADLYDSSAASYVTPDSVKAHIEENGPYQTAWSFPIAEAWFTGKGM